MNKIMLKSLSDSSNIRVISEFGSFDYYISWQWLHFFPCFFGHPIIIYGMLGIMCKTVETQANNIYTWRQALLCFQAISVCCWHNLVRSWTKFEFCVGFANRQCTTGSSFLWNCLVFRMGVRVPQDFSSSQYFCSTLSFQLSLNACATKGALALSFSTPFP